MPRIPRISRSAAVKLGITALLVFGAIQVVPYRVPSADVSQSAVWDSPETEALARQACYDCHSSEGQTPWYGHIAPVGWLVTNHVREGRAELNLSQLDRPQDDAHEASEMVADGEMPPAYYRLTHPRARLTSAQRQQLAEGLDAALAGTAAMSGRDAHEAD